MAHAQRVAAWVWCRCVPVATQTIKTLLALSQYNIRTMDVLLGIAHSDAWPWTTQLKSNALLITIVLFAVVEYMYICRCYEWFLPAKAKTESSKTDSFKFAKIVQLNENKKVRSCTVDSDGDLVNITSNVNMLHNIM